MGARYLTDLAEVLRDSGLSVVEVDGWEDRARSSGGFDGDRPWAIMWHHTASDTSPQNDVNYICHGSPDAPISNLYLARDGQVWVCAGGATNTNGKGGPTNVSRGTVPLDSMNTYAVSIEAGNNGVGEPWPEEQINAYFAVNNALAAAYGLAATDCVSHHEWAKDRKIDPAVATSVYGPWMPRSLNSSGTWSLDDIRSEAARRAGSPPTPTPGGDDVQVRLLILTDSDAQFIAQTDDEGQALYVTWAGPGSPSVDRAVAAHRAEAARKGYDFEQEGDIAGLFNCVRIGELPYGDSRHVWTEADFWKSVT